MSEAPPEEDWREPGASPRVGLTYALDDDANPTTITVYPSDRTDVTTTWLTMDLDHAVDLYDVA